jgi:hypothetical protein
MAQFSCSHIDYVLHELKVLINKYTAVSKRNHGTHESKQRESCRFRAERWQSIRERE